MVFAIGRPGLWALIGPEAKSSVPALIPLLQENGLGAEPFPPYFAAEALEEFGPEAGTATAALVELLNPRQQQPERFGFDVGERQRNRVQAAAALLAIGPAAIPIPE